MNIQVVVSSVVSHYQRYEADEELLTKLCEYYSFNLKDFKRKLEVAYNKKKKNEKI